MLRRVWKTIQKRSTSEYVLAKRVDGKLEVADFAREDKDFCFSPKISADVLINGGPGKCTIKGMYRTVEEGKVGKLLNIQYPKNAQWYGFLKAEGEEDSIIFSLDNADCQLTGAEKVNWQSNEENNFSFDVVCYLHDESKLQAINNARTSTILSYCSSIFY